MRNMLYVKNAFESMLNLYYVSAYYIRSHATHTHTFHRYIFPWKADTLYFNISCCISSHLLRCLYFAFSTCPLFVSRGEGKGGGGGVYSVSTLQSISIVTLLFFVSYKECPLAMICISGSKIKQMRFGWDADDED